MTQLVVGADVGGTSTRVAVARLDGTVLGAAVGGPGNPNSVGVAGAAAEIRSVATSALAGVDGSVVAVVLALAGGSRTEAAPDFLRAAVPDEVPVPAVLVSDLAAAYCSATPAAAGSVLVSGTGAVAGRVVGAELVEQRDGWGWLLGDEGSGFWLGRAAVRAALADLQRDTAVGPLTRAVLAATGTGSYLELLQACYLEPPAALARFAPLVSQHAEHDPDAARIATEAVEHLQRLIGGMTRRAGEPLVLAGSVLSSAGPVRDELCRRLVRDRPGEQLLTASSGVVGALWIALRGLSYDDSPRHGRLVASCRPWV